MAAADEADSDKDILDAFADTDSDESDIEGFDEDDIPLAYLHRGGDSSKEESEEDDDHQAGAWRDATTGDSVPEVLPVFRRKPRLQLNSPENPKPLDFFKLYNTDKMLKLVVKETNLFAIQTLEATELCAKSQMWK